ncbi:MULTISPECIES: DoxX family protein [Enterobacterales]|jgi:putative oxidoreductase|uniref:DoxX family protein n=1 Tax=Enterobacterales TaxID=91347 RepID=UPI000643485A|nr:DoxX family protein [Enterobacter genomosp. O]KLP60696.1 transmembrane DoxX protein [Enterobacter genomosp. O]
MIQYQSLFHSSGMTHALPLTLIRVTFGLFFFASGFNKVFVPSSQVIMLETITEAGIPFPAFMAVFVASCETFFGLILSIGLLTRPGALVLMIISLVALFTVGLNHIPTGLNFLTWYSWLLYLPESVYILICILLIVQGGGPWGVDRVIARRLNRSGS